MQPQPVRTGPTPHSGSVIFLAEHLWEVDVFVEENHRRLINSITVQAESEDEALRLAMAEMSRALAILSSRSKVVGARARRK